jgi:hypothetical protein
MTIDIPKMIDALFLLIVLVTVTFVIGEIVIRKMLFNLNQKRAKFIFIEQKDEMP